MTFRGARPEQLICVGGESYDPQLLEILTQITGVKAVAESPLKHIAAEGIFTGADRKSGLLEWATATGLALKGMDPALSAVAS